ncbi:MAG: hypothetical protein WC683_09955 [bacterium]
MLHEWRDKTDVDRAAQFDDALARFFSAAHRWTFREMGIFVRWRLCFEVAAVVFIVVSVLWIAEAVPQALVSVR